MWIAMAILYGVIVGALALFLGLPGWAAVLAAMIVAGGIGLIGALMVQSGQVSRIEELRGGKIDE